jgi:hypothetical protein
MRKATDASAADVRGLSIIRLRGRELSEHIIHVSLDDPLLLSSSLAHELMHLMAGAVSGYRPLPGAIAEGLAIQAEPRCRHTQFGRLFAGSKRPRGLEALLAIGETHPKSPAFYAEAFRLVAVLKTKGGLGPLLDEAGNLPASAGMLARQFGYGSRAQLEQAYLGKTRDPAANAPMSP